MRDAVTFLVGCVLGRLVVQAITTHPANIVIAAAVGLVVAGYSVLAWHVLRGRQDPS